MGRQKLSLRELRERHQMTLERLSNRSGLPVDQLRRLEAGVQPMSIDQAEKLAWLFKVDALDLLD